MADDKSKVGQPDRLRINTSEDYEVHDWARELGVSVEQLRAAVKAVGPMAADVRKYLKQQPSK